MQTDIYFIKRKSEHIFNIIENEEAINKIKSLKPLEKNEYIIYVHGNLHLIIDDKTKEKVCMKIDKVSTSINDDLIFITGKTLELPIETFPLINSYDNIFRQTVTLYNNNIYLVKDNKCCYFRIKNNSSVSIQMISNFLNSI